MKRLNMGGHARTVLAAVDGIEVVKGLPSPIYGMGKIGGYTHRTPESGRAITGARLTEPLGFAQFTAGSYNRRELTFGGGGLLSALGKGGGYYVFGLIEDSETFTCGIPIKTKMVQAAVSLDDVFGDFRMEIGPSAQITRTAGAVLGRLTQDTIDTGAYIRGTPLVHLDFNNNGSTGVLEYNTASPVTGNPSAGNQPLLQRFALPVDTDGNPVLPKGAGQDARSSRNSVVPSPSARLSRCTTRPSPSRPSRGCASGGAPHSGIAVLASFAARPCRPPTRSSREAVAGCRQSLGHLRRGADGTRRLQAPRLGAPAIGRTAMRYGTQALSSTASASSSRRSRLR